MSEAAALYARQRREFALLMGTAWFIYGLVIAFTFPYTSDVIEWLPSGRIGPEFIGGYIAVFGVIATVLACLSNCRRPRFERAAYGVLVGAPLLVTLSFFAGALLDYVPTGWTSGTQMALLAGAAYFMSGLRPSDKQIAQATSTQEEEADGP